MGLLMKILLIWICATAAMDDCKPRQIGEPMPFTQCEKTIEAYTELLGTGAEQNYRFECQDA